MWSPHNPFFGVLCAGLPTGFKINKKSSPKGTPGSGPCLLFQSHHLHCPSLNPRVHQTPDSPCHLPRCFRARCFHTAGPSSGRATPPPAPSSPDCPLRALPNSPLAICHSATNTTWRIIVLLKGLPDLTLPSLRAGTRSFILGSPVPNTEMFMEGNHQETRT